MVYFGYFFSVIIGVTLGLIGGGGSILTIPILVYLFSVDAVSATAYSLFIVGVTSAVGSVNYFKHGWVNLQTLIFFGVPSIISVFLTRAYLVPAIPKEIITIGNFVLTKSVLILLLFAVLMIAASYNMIKKSKIITEEPSPQQVLNYPIIFVEGAIIGMLTGFVGAGGGFLIIPALTFLFKLPMKEAVGTSLAIVAVNSLIGFIGESSETLINWRLIGIVTSLAILGIFIGITLSKKIDGAKLKPAFGWFVLVMGIYIIIKETLFQ